MRALPDAAARDRIRRDHDTTLIVEAAAGTGKTTSVVERVVEMIAVDTARIGQVAAITFTEKAAGELRLRIRQGLELRIEHAAAGPEGAAATARLEAALSQIEEASIGTIHAFCATILRERPIEAGVDPDFQILTDAEQRAFFDRVFRRFLDRQLEAPGPGIARLLRRSRNPMVSPLDILQQAGLRLLDYRSLDAPWKRRAWDAEAAVRELVEEPGGQEGEPVPSLFMLEELYRSLPKDPPGARPNWLIRSLAAAADLAREIRVRGAASGSDLDWLEQALAELRVPGYGGRTPAGFPHTRKWRDAFRTRLLAFQRESNADLAALLREDLRGLVADYGNAKQKAGLVDFDDLLLKTRDLLRDHPEVREELAARFRHIVVDEYQDTDPMQTEIVLLLTAGEPPGADWREAVPLPGRLCLVGDPKQSIYRFRRADVGHYLRVKERLLANGAAEVRLSTNFRSVPGICDFVNRTLRPAFEAAPGLGGLARQVDYVPLHAARGPMPGPALAAIPLAHAPYVKHLEEQEPKAVAAFVGGLLDSGFAVSGADGNGSRPVEPSDICLLFRRFRSYRRLVPQPYADALQDLGIPHSLAAVQTYIGSAELSFLRAALTAIEFPEDELSVYATLRGPLFAIPDQDLFLFRERHPETRLRPALARRLEPGGGDATAARGVDRTIRDSLAFLYDLHRRRTHQPIAVTLQQLLGRHRAETGFAFWNSPDQVLSNLRRLVEAARAFEARGGLSFRGFVEQLAAEAENPDAGSAHAIDEDVRGVRIMTTHTAKGLEFPVVVLCDGAVRRHGRASRIVNAEKRLYACDLGAGIVPWDLLEGTPAEEAEDLAELDRLLYVAMTRGRDLLAAPVSEGDFPEESLLAPVEAGLKPLLGQGGITPRTDDAAPAVGAGGRRGDRPAVGPAPGGCHGRRGRRREGSRSRLPRAVAAGHRCRAGPDPPGDPGDGVRRAGGRRRSRRTPGRRTSERFKVERLPPQDAERPCRGRVRGVGPPGPRAGPAGRRGDGRSKRKRPGPSGSWSWATISAPPRRGRCGPRSATRSWPRRGGRRNTGRATASCRSSTWNRLTKTAWSRHRENWAGLRPAQRAKGPRTTQPHPALTRHPRARKADVLWSAPETASALETEAFDRATRRLRRPRRVRPGAGGGSRRPRLPAGRGGRLDGPRLQDGLAAARGSRSSRPARPATAGRSVSTSGRSNEPPASPPRASCCTCRKAPAWAAGQPGRHARCSAPRTASPDPET